VLNWRQDVGHGLHSLASRWRRGGERHNAVEVCSDSGSAPCTSASTSRSSAFRRRPLMIVSTSRAGAYRPTGGVHFCQIWLQSDGHARDPHCVIESIFYAEACPPQVCSNTWVAFQNFLLKRSVQPMSHHESEIATSPLETFQLMRRRTWAACPSSLPLAQPRNRLPHLPLLVRVWKGNVSNDSSTLQALQVTRAHRKTA
jgi:hypothetical protein